VVVDDAHAGELGRAALGHLARALDAHQVLALQPGAVAGKQELLEGPLDVARRERLARVEHDVVAQVEAPAEIVGARLPALGEHRDDAALGVGIGEALIDVLENVARDQRRVGDRVDHLRIGVDVDAQVARLRRTHCQNRRNGAHNLQQPASAQHLVPPCDRPPDGCVNGNTRGGRGTRDRCPRAIKELCGRPVVFL
jgi:hypothetical protein